MAVSGQGTGFPWLLSMLRLRDDCFGKGPRCGPLAAEDVDQPSLTLDDGFAAGCGKIGLAGDNRPDACKSRDYIPTRNNLKKTTIVVGDQIVDFLVAGRATIRVGLADLGGTCLLYTSRCV